MASKEFSNTLKNLRIKAGYTQKQVYEHFDIPQSTFSSWEVGKSEPSGDMLIKLCEFYKCDMMKEFSSSDDVVFTSAEYDHIKKYRLISEKDIDGKALVDTTVNYLCNRIQQIREKDSRLTELQSENPTKITRLLRYYYGGVSAGSGVYMLNGTESKEIEVPATPETSKADFVVPVSGNSMEPLYHDGDKILISQSDGTLEIGEIGIFVKNGDAFIKKLGQNELVSLNKEYDNIPLNDFDNVVCLGKVIGRLE